MGDISESKLYKDLLETGKLLQLAEPVEGEEYSLEAILAEYGNVTIPPEEPVLDDGADTILVSQEPEEESVLFEAVQTQEKEDTSVEEDDIKIAMPTSRKKQDKEPSEDTGDLPGTVKQAARKVKERSKVKETGADDTHAFVRTKTKENNELSDTRPIEKIASVEKKPFLKKLEVKEKEVPFFDVEEPEGRREIPLEQVFSDTVESVLDEDDGILETQVSAQEKLKNLFVKRRERRPIRRGLSQDTEQLWDMPESYEEIEEEESQIEPELEDALRECRWNCKRLHSQLIITGFFTLVQLVIAVLCELSAMPQFWQSGARIRHIILGALLVVELLTARNLWKSFKEQITHLKFTCEGAVILASIATILDCGYGVIRENATLLPLCAPAAIAIWMCLFGQYLMAETRRKMFYLANMGGEPIFSVSITAAGACKQRGRLTGFYTNVFAKEPDRLIQSLLVPIICGVATVLTGIVAFASKTTEYFWIWSAMLLAGIPLSMPLSGVLPMSYLNKRLNKSGCAVAGYYGAKKVSNSKRMVLSDDDLFPPGTVGINGLKVFGEEISKVISYAASMTKEANSQLSPLFEQLLAAEGGFHAHVDDLQFLNEGGIRGTIEGATVLMGSANFMRKMKVTLPAELKVKTGQFLAIDGTLAAIFAIKYQPSRNVEWALRAMRRCHIIPVMGVRGGNITPTLIKRKFAFDGKLIYPDISTRLALSELTEEYAEESNAIIYREGLMPYAEIVIGSRRAIRAVRNSTIICYIGSICGMFLSYYFSNAGSMASLSPLRMLVFMALWLVPAILISGLVKHY